MTAKKRSGRYTKAHVPGTGRGPSWWKTLAKLRAESKARRRP